MDIDAIQAGLAEAAATIDGLQTFPYLPDAIDPPSFAPVELEIDYHGTFSPGRGLTQIVVSCGIYTSRGDSESGRRSLAQYLSSDGALSLPAALEADKTLGGTCKTLLVQRARGSGRLYDVAGIEFLGAIIEVRVWA